jgi:hypothetical protein
MNPVERRIPNASFMGMIIALWVLLYAVRILASPEIQLPVDFNNCDPVEYRAAIMAVDYEKAQLIVAEETVFVVDLILAEERFKTEVVNAKGESKPLGSFKQGDYVLVKGFKQSAGGVIAVLIKELTAGEMPWKPNGKAFSKKQAEP